MYSERSAHLAPEFMFGRLKGMCDECVSEKEREKVERNECGAFEPCFPGKCTSYQGMPQMVCNGNGYIL